MSLFVLLSIVFVTIGKSKVGGFSLWFHKCLEILNPHYRQVHFFTSRRRSLSIHSRWHPKSLTLDQNIIRLVLKARLVKCQCPWYKWDHQADWPQRCWVLEILRGGNTTFLFIVLLGGISTFPCPYIVRLCYCNYLVTHDFQTTRERGFSIDLNDLPDFFPLVLHVSIENQARYTQIFELFFGFSLETKKLNQS